MKVLLALALVAAVAAVPMPEPVELGVAPEPQVFEDDSQFADISFLPLYLPDDVVESFQKDLEENPPLETVDEDLVATPVEFVFDAPEDFNSEYVHPLAYGFPVEEQVAENAEEEIEPSPVAFVDADNVEVAPEVAEEENIFSPVEVADDADVVPAPVNFVEVAPEADDVAPVNFDIDVVAEEADVAEESEVAPSAINFVDVAPEAEEVVAPVSFDADDEEIQYQELPSPLVFDDPMLR